MIDNDDINHGPQTQELVLDCRTKDIEDDDFFYDDDDEDYAAEQTDQQRRVDDYLKEDAQPYKDEHDSFFDEEPGEDPEEPMDLIISPGDEKREEEEQTDK